MKSRGATGCSSRGGRDLGVKLECCRLASLVEQERELQEAARVAARKAEVRESVRAALAARAAEPEPEPELEHSLP